MRDDLDDAELAAIQARVAMARDFIGVMAKDRSTGAVTFFGFHNDLGDLTVTVKDGRTEELVSRPFHGDGALVSVGSIQLTSDIAVNTVDVVLSQIDDVVQEAVRTYDVRNAPIQIWRGFFDPRTHQLLAPPKARLVGFVDGAPIETPAEGNDGSVTLHCVTTTRELTRTNPEVRSHASQLARSGGADDFYIDTAVVGEWQLFWGQKNGTVSA